MIRLFKDSYKLSLLLASVFFVSILVSAYILYTLPHAIMLGVGFEQVLAKTYIVIAISFLLGAGAIYMALKSQREIVVYKDRTIEAENETNKTRLDETKTTITLENVITGLQQSRTEKEILKTYLQIVCKQVDAGQGALYLTTGQDDAKKVELKGGYALNVSENNTIAFDFGEGLIGQCAANGLPLYVDDVPEGYIKIISGLGSASPRYIIIEPVLDEKEVIGVLEIASFTAPTKDQRKFIEESIQLLAEKIS